MMRIGSALAALAFAAAVSPAAAVAQSAAGAETPPAVRQEIVVTASREEQPRDQASAAVTVLTRDDIERLPANSLAELLAFVPGVTMLSESGASGLPTITSRGFFGGGEVEYVKLVVDGVPVGDAESGNVDWQRFRAGNIERMEILHGPGSALYGDTALGGVIQLFTRPATRNESTGSLHLGSGSFGARELQASYRTSIRNGLQLSAEADDWTTAGFRDNAGTDGRRAHLGLERLHDRSRWRLDAEGERADRQQPGALTRAEIADDREQSNSLFDFDGQSTTRGRISGAYDSYGSTPLHAMLYGIRRDDDNLRTLLLAPGFGASAMRALTTRVGGGSFEASREGTRGVLRLGADLEHADLSARYADVSETGATGDSVAFEDGTRNRTALFVTGGWLLSDRWRLTAAVRRDDIRDDLTSTTTGGSARKRTASAWSPRAGLNVHLGPAAAPYSLFVQASSAFKAPTLDQLFDARPYPDGVGGTFTIANPDLRPQRARNLEAGLSRTTARSDWSIVGYRMTVRDEIDFDPQTFSYRNIGSSLHRGLEASLGLATTARISPRLTYAWTHVADRATPDRNLKNIPEHVAQLLLHARLNARTTADLTYRWRDSLALDDEQLFRTPAVSRVDLRVARELGSLRLHVDLLNALDARYNELGYVLVDFRGQPAALEFPAPGRALRLGITWLFSARRNG